MSDDAMMASIRSEVQHLALRPGASASPDEVEASLAMLDGLMAWLGPYQPALTETIRNQDAAFLLELGAQGIEIDPDALHNHSLAMTFVLLAKLVRHGAIELPPC